MENKVQLICYADRLSGGNLNDLIDLLEGPMNGIFGGIHILPFYFPIDGADAGFDPIDHTIVDPKLGNWEDIKVIASQMDLMADMIVNHTSDDSPQFQDFSKKGSNSEFADLFLTMNDVFPEGATEEDLLSIYRPRPGLPFTVKTLENGETRLLWTTFTSKQIDINVHSDAGRAYLMKILDRFAEAGVKAIRLDATGYAIKKAGTSCFMIPETFDFIADFTEKAHTRGMEVLVEIHSYYKKQIEIAKKVDFVYDFALPPLILHAIYNRTGTYLKKWLDISPRNCISVLDTHDGIGVIDIGPSGKHKELKGLVPDVDIDRMVETMHEMTNGQSRLATGAAASNLDLYQVNATYYDVLGKNDEWYLLARAIQFFAPGIPQVYYQGFLAEPNDMELLAHSNVGRDINRHYFSKDEVIQAMRRPVVQELIALIKIRNEHPGFNGEIDINIDQNVLTIRRYSGEDSIRLKVDFKTLKYQIEF